VADAMPVQPERQLHPATAQILRYFDHAHLPPHLQVVSAPFSELAHYVAETLQLDGPELTAGLRKMLEGKDCVVRAALDVEPPALMARAGSGVPEGPLVVQQVTHDRGTRTLTVGIACPLDLSPAQLADAVRDEVLFRLEHRSAAERSDR
jgi:hypothetical protein